jgi:hypothetical protein
MPQGLYRMHSRAVATVTDSVDRTTQIAIMVQYSDSASTSELAFATQTMTIFGRQTMKRSASISKKKK